MAILRILGFVFVAIAALGGGYYVYTNYLHVQTVTTSLATVAPVSEAIYGTGTVEPERWAKVVPLDRRRLIELCSCEGQYVKAGQVLGRQDDADERSALHELEVNNEQLVREVAELSDQITVEILNLAIDRERAEAYGVDQVPAIVVEGSRDWGIRFYGVPLGYEFSNLIDAIIVASSGEPTLSEGTLASLRALASDVDIKVFSTPT